MGTIYYNNYMTQSCEICTLLPNTKYVLLETDLWMVSLAPDQQFLGRSFVTAKKHTRSLATLSKAQWDDLHQVMIALENAISSAYGADLFNWACLMNDAYKDTANTQSPHVHFHVRPRYKNTVYLQGYTFTDNDFGKHYKTPWDDPYQRAVPQTIMDAIYLNIQEYLGS